MTQTVETFRGISLLIFKWLLYAILGLVALGAVIAGITYGYNYVTYDRQASNVTIAVHPLRLRCTDDSFPLWVTIRNGSSKALERVGFRLEARRRGYSSNLATSNTYYSDKFPEPGRTYGSCWSAPLKSATKDDPHDLEWTIGTSSITFATE